MDSNPAIPPLKRINPHQSDTEEEEEEEEYKYKQKPIGKRSPFKSPGEGGGGSGNDKGNHSNQLAMLVAVLRRSLLFTCSVDTEEDVSFSSSSSATTTTTTTTTTWSSRNMEISWPTEVRHVSHVTFDPLNGFLGLPSELFPDLPDKVPSASASVFGVSAKSMQCSYDDRGNSVPTILLMMQRRLYVEGGLKAEGIFRINAENSQEKYVRDQINKGILPCGIDVHCVAVLIKAWFRELPSGLLDSLTPEQVMLCNTKEDCTQLVKLLPPTEASLLDWAINLMADVVEQEQYNKMNARNIAMVFAPNMTRMADTLTALIHAVQVMNLLKTLILRTFMEREEYISKCRSLSSIPDSSSANCEPCQLDLNSRESTEKSLGLCGPDVPIASKLLSSATMNRLEHAIEDQHWNFRNRSSEEEELISNSGSNPPSHVKLEP